MATEFSSTETDPEGARANARAERLHLTVVDESPECEWALRYTALYAQRVGGKAAVFAAHEAPASADWVSLSEEMAAEERARVEQLLANSGAHVQSVSGTHPELFAVPGAARDGLLDLLERDQRIVTLILAAAPGGGNPGPLVSALTGRFLSRLRVPLILLPHAFGADVDLSRHL